MHIHTRYDNSILQSINCYSVNRFELLKADRRSSAKVTDFFGSERKMIPLTTKASAIIYDKVDDIDDNSIWTEHMDTLSVSETISLKDASNKIEDGKKDLKLLISIIFIIPVCATMIYSLLDT